jgi:hypothetical protein
LFQGLLAITPCLPRSIDFGIVMLEIPEKSVLRIGEIAWSCNVWATYRTMVTVRFP